MYKILNQKIYKNNEVHGQNIYKDPRFTFCVLMSIGAPDKHFFQSTCTG